MVLDTDLKVIEVEYDVATQIEVAKLELLKDKINFCLLAIGPNLMLLDVFNKDTLSKIT